MLRTASEIAADLLQLCASNGIDTWAAELQMFGRCRTDVGNIARWALIEVADGSEPCAATYAEAEAMLRAREVR